MRSHVHHCMLLLAGTAGLAGVACAPGPEDQGSSDDLLEDTIVTAKPDGTYDQRTVQVTRQERARQTAARDAAAREARLGVLRPIQAIAGLTSDSTCAGADMWMYDQPNNTGRRVCFVRSSSAPFDWYNYALLKRASTSNWPYFVTWGWAVRSYYSGNDPGYFRTTDAVPAVESFGVMKQANTVTSATANATILFLQQPSWSPSFRVQLDGPNPQHNNCGFGSAVFEIDNLPPPDGFMIDNNPDSVAAFDNAGNLVCRATYDIPGGQVAKISAGRRYPVTMNVLSASRTCNLWTLEGKMYAESNGKLWASPINLANCQSL